MFPIQDLRNAQKALHNTQKMHEIERFFLMRRQLLDARSTFHHVYCPRDMTHHRAQNRRTTTVCCCNGLSEYKQIPVLENAL